jgi:hypothetical protein
MREIFFQFVRKSHQSGGQDQAIGSNICAILSDGRVSG